MIDWSVLVIVHLRVYRSTLVNPP